MAMSTLGPECDTIPDKGGYTVQPVPAPSSIKVDVTKLTKAQGINQKEILFNLANDISLAPINNGNI
jgi:hypothetical protein